MSIDWQARRSRYISPRGANDHRAPYERDHNRVIHCEAFRLLQGKKQVFSIANKDFHRTRLTHSLEVASIARSISRNLSQRYPAYHPILPCDDLISAISLLHDIGHPPFGHAGEQTLNKIMTGYGGYESNGQTLRIVTKLDQSYGQFGLDLTRRTLLGVLKYPCAYTTLANTHDVVGHALPPPKCYLAEEQDIVDWLLTDLDPMQKQYFQRFTPASSHSHGQSLHATLDCQIMTLADDIAYAIHDIEDAIYYHFLAPENFQYPGLDIIFQRYRMPFTLEELVCALFSDNRQKQRAILADLINELITSVELKQDAGRSLLDDHILTLTLSLPEGHRYLLQCLKGIAEENVFEAEDIQIHNRQGKEAIQHLFEVLLTKAKNDGCEGAATRRKICDHISLLSEAAVLNA